MTNALVFIEACVACGRVQRTYLGRRIRRRTPTVCAECARPWLQWACRECGAVVHEQVERLPGRGAHVGVCSACDAEADRIAWTRSTADEAAAAEEKRLEAGARRGRLSDRAK